MPKFAFPRERGAGNGRAPQLGPGTFDARSGNDMTQKPAALGAVAWSEGPPPALELWCYLNIQNGARFEPVRQGNDTTVWLDKVGAGEEFIKPALDVEAAFKTYARNRYLSKTSTITRPQDWVVQIARPFNFAQAAYSQRKILSGFYQVVQADPGGTGAPGSWVYVQENREVWLHHDLGEVGGFCIVGTEDPGTGQVRSNTRLVFGTLPEPGVDLMANYGGGIATLKNLIVNSDAGVMDGDELTIHDYRISRDY